MNLLKDTIKPTVQFFVAPEDESAVFGTDYVSWYHLSAKLDMPEDTLRSLYLHWKRADKHDEFFTRAEAVEFYKFCKSLMTWDDIQRQLSDISRNSLYSVTRKHPDVKPVAVAVRRNEQLFRKEDALRFVRWYKRNHQGAALENLAKLDPSEVIVGYEGLWEYTAKVAKRPITVDGAGYYQRLYGELKPDFGRRGPNGGRPKAHFFRSNVDAFLERHGLLKED